MSNLFSKASRVRIGTKIIVVTVFLGLAWTISVRKSLRPILLGPDQTLARQTPPPLTKQEPSPLILVPKATSTPDNESPQPEETPSQSPTSWLLPTPTQAVNSEEAPDRQSEAYPISSLSPKSLPQEPSADPQNYNRCMNGYYPCNHSLLTTEQEYQVDASDRRRNLSKCLNGYYPCNRSLLSTDEASQVDTNEARRNLSRCLNGYYPCNRNLLSADEVSQVDVNEVRRNLSRCLNGYYPCNRSLLSTAEAYQVDTNEIRRNLSRCLNGYHPCNRSLLTNDEADRVNDAEARRNFSRCLNGYSPCNRALLTTEQAAEVQRRRPN